MPRHGIIITFDFNSNQPQISLIIHKDINIIIIYIYPKTHLYGYHAINELGQSASSASQMGPARMILVLP